MAAEKPVAAAVRTYADHVRDWEAARAAIAEARKLFAQDEWGCVSFSGLAVYFYKHGGTLLDAMENLLDATAFQDRAALRRQTEIVQQIAGREQPLKEDRS